MPAIRLQWNPTNADPMLYAADEDSEKYLKHCAGGYVGVTEKTWETVVKPLMIAHGWKFQITNQKADAAKPIRP